MAENLLRISQVGAKKIFNEKGNALSIHFRMNTQAKEFEIIVNESCKKCKKFFLLHGKSVCLNCKYEENWLVNGIYSNK